MIVFLSHDGHQLDAVLNEAPALHGTPSLTISWWPSLVFEFKQQRYDDKIESALPLEVDPFLRFTSKVSQLVLERRGSSQNNDTFCGSGLYTLILSTLIR